MRLQTRPTPVWADGSGLLTGSLYVLNRKDFYLPHCHLIFFVPYTYHNNQGKTLLLSNQMAQGYYTVRT